MKATRVKVELCDQVCLTPGPEREVVWHTQMLSGTMQSLRTCEAGPKEGHRADSSRFNLV